MTGPGSLTHREVVGHLAEVAGRTVEIGTITPAEALARRPPGLPAEVMTALLAGAAASVGAPASVTNTVERLTGRPARTLRDWGGEHAADFAPR